MATVFTLEAVFARHGDALVLHWGDWDEPKRLLIDGGPQGVYESFLEPRLAQMRDDFELDEDAPIPFEMVMVSHIDDDHVAGVIGMFEALERAIDTEQPRPYKIGRLWHNSFDDILGNQDEEIASKLAAAALGNDGGEGLSFPDADRETLAVVASTRQGRHLRDLARKLRVKVNEPFEGLIMAPADEDRSLGAGLSLRVVGPSLARVERYRKQWDKDLKKILEKEKKAKTVAFTDSSPFNLASICVLAELDGKRMLLTGDARGDHLMDGLEQAGLLSQDEPLHVDLFKLPHHGSVRNAKLSLFERVRADHYVVSGDGHHGNPEVDTLDMIATARGRERYTIHFTFTKGAAATEPRAEAKEALEKAVAWAERQPKTCTVRFRDEDEETHSICVDLLDPLYEA